MFDRAKTTLVNLKIDKKTYFSIPVISDMTTVHNFTKEISKIVPWNFAISFQVIVKDINRDRQVTNIEWIGSIPTLRTEFSSFADNGVEIAQ